MIAAFEDEDLDAIARGEVDRSTLQTDNASRNYDKVQICSTCLRYGYRNGMWTYIVSYFDGK